MMSTNGPLIVCENLVKIYQVADLEVLALQGLDLLVQRGELLGIVGASGSGKTTLMNVLGGLVRPSAGRAIVSGQDLLKLSDAALDRYRRTQVGFVWQQGARNLVTYLNARENVALPMMLAGFDSRHTRERADDLLDMVGLAERQEHYLPQLSGGEQQRVAIAVALANEPQLLLADEPTGELDSATALTIYDAFQRLNAELGLTILIVSHDQGIARHVHRVMAIRDGKAASETVRARRETAGEAGEPDGDEHFEELLVLDSAGRLQVPKQLREELGIRDRVRAEVIDGGLLLRPLEPGEQVPDNHAAAAQEDGPVRPGRRSWLARLRGDS